MAVGPPVEGKQGQTVRKTATGILTDKKTNIYILTQIHETSRQRKDKERERDTES